MGKGKQQRKQILTSPQPWNTKSAFRLNAYANDTIICLQFLLTKKTGSYLKQIPHGLRKNL